jgi:hypothetical protein
MTDAELRETAELMDRAAWRAGVIGAINAVTAILAIRMIVMMSVLGGIGLTFIALGEPDPYRLGALTIYTVAVVMPVVWLASR